MKKLLALILAMLMIASIFSGCANEAKVPADTEKNDDPISNDDLTANEETKKVLFSTVSLEGGLSIFDELLRPAVEQYGYEYECVSCDGDAVKQIEQVENGVAKGFDLIFIYPVTGEALADACKAAMDQGVYVYNFLNDTTHHDVIFCDDPEANGKLIADMALEWVDATFPNAEAGSVNTAILGCSNDAYNVRLSDAARAVLYEDARINILEDYDIEYSTSAAQAAAENVMTMHPDQQINLWVGIAAIIIDGINAAVTSENSGAGDLTKIGSIYPSPLNDEAVEKLKLSQDNTTIVRGIMCTGGDLSVNFQNMATEIDALLQGETVEPFHYSPIEPVWFEDLPNYGY